MSNYSKGSTMNRAISGTLQEQLSKRTGIDLRGVIDPEPLLEIYRLRSTLNDKYDRLRERDRYILDRAQRIKEIIKGLNIEGPMRTRYMNRAIRLRKRAKDRRIRMEERRDNVLKILDRAEQEVLIRQYRRIQGGLHEDISKLGLMVGHQNTEQKDPLQDVLGV